MLEGGDLETSRVKGIPVSSDVSTTAETPGEGQLDWTQEEFKNFVDKIARLTPSTKPYHPETMYRQMQRWAQDNSLADNLELKKALLSIPGLLYRLGFRDPSRPDYTPYLDEPVPSKNLTRAGWRKPTPSGAPKSPTEVQASAEEWKWTPEEVESFLNRVASFTKTPTTSQDRNQMFREMQALAREKNIKPIEFEKVAKVLPDLMSRLGFTSQDLSSREGWLPAPAGEPKPPFKPIAETGKK